MNRQTMPVLTYSGLESITEKVSGFSAYPYSGGGRGPYKTDQAHQCGHGPECGRPGKIFSKLCNAGSDFRGRAEMVVGVVPL